MHLRLLLAALFVALFSLTGCQTSDMQGIHSTRYGDGRRGVITSAIRSEEPGNYFIGRRYYKRDYKFWGYVRSPGKAWSTAKLVMLNEQQKLAPDRELGRLGSDNNYEYRLQGQFSGETVYEPASNNFYPEFVLRGYELRSVSPENIYRSPGALDPARRIIAQPY